MSAKELITQTNMTPTTIASDLLNVIKDIERSIEDSNSNIERVEGRGTLKSIFSSSKSDLVDISKSQNKINELMLGLIQEIITLNTMSYSFLAAVISELEISARNGWLDSEGRTQELSATGKAFADRAHGIFCKIAEGSKSTQTRIDLNKQDIDSLKLEFSAKAEVVQQSRNDIASIKTVLNHKAEIVARQSKDIGQIHSVLETKTERLASIDKLLETKTERLASIDKLLQSKSERLASIDERLQEKSITDQNQNQAIQEILATLQMTQQLDLQRVAELKEFKQDSGTQLAQLREQAALSVSQYAKLVRTVAVVAGIAVISSVALGLNIARII